jgi:ubiquinone biosynthesis protein
LGLFGKIRRSFARLKRYRHIVAVLMKYGFKEVNHAFSGRFKVKGGGEEKPSGENIAQSGGEHDRPWRVRMALQEMGPTFVKFGQLLSTRPDLVAKEYIDELEKLQDHVEPAPWNDVRELLKDELGGKPEDIFASFDTEPIAAGSIGQVYKAVTKDGRDIVLKVRRPGVVELIRTECEILTEVAKILKPRFGDSETVDPERMVNEFIDAISDEVDFANERRNQKRFIMNFQDDETIHIPEILDEYCTDAIISMEYIDGIKPSAINLVKDMGFEPKVIAQRGADFVLKQVFDYGFFHTDPHPGNFFVLNGNVLAPIDFGQVGRLDSIGKRLLKDTVVSIVTREASHMVHALERAEMIDDRTDTAELLKDIEGLFDSYYGLAIKDIPFRETMQEGFDIMREHYIRPPSDYTLMMKSLMTIESFAVGLDEDFQIIDYLKPYAKQFSFEDIKPSNVFKNIRKTALGAGDFIANLPEDAKAILSKLRKGKAQIRVHHEHLDTLNDTLGRSSNRLSFAVIIAALLVASSLLVGQDGDVLGIVKLQTLGVIGYLTAAIMGLWLMVSILRSKHF